MIDFRRVMAGLMFCLFVEVLFVTGGVYGIVLFVIDSASMKPVVTGMLMLGWGSFGLRGTCRLMAEVLDKWDGR